MNTVSAPSEFGDLLRSWRHERRLSQGALANAIETPSRHVSFLETGRAQPSREMVTRLSTALQVPLRDRNLLLRAAGFADLYAEATLSDAEADMLRNAVLRMMTAHDPCPAFVIDRFWEVHDANASGRRLLGRIAEAFPFDPPHVTANMLDMTFSPDGIRPYIRNWTDYARQAIQRLHREALSPDDLRGALDRIAAYPELPKDWWALDVRYAHDPVFPIEMEADGRRLNFFSVIAAIATPTGALAQELRVETLFPADDATEAALKAAISGTA
ncbi:helix-turn-helix domain-containing protein [Pontivivens ytuae]|uniref:Helix-turn-helix domain-containing protein n=1 Tax=Pontivivens ytuae TaxID=2789856 RepID=A0A7S9LUY2_9RHOB|nr:helix-turn-helix transcriptional regulator [Pontivivens ytuae]QPH55724.1 helix-turn-helix domain-containing protein [Pontivivens ytuae]